MSKIGSNKKVINILTKLPETLVLLAVHHFLSLFFPCPNPCRFQPVLREFFGLFSFKISASLFRHLADCFFIPAEQERGFSRLWRDVVVDLFARFGFLFLALYRNLFLVHFRQAQYELLSLFLFFTAP